MDHHAFDPPGETHSGGPAASDPAADDDLDFSGDDLPVFNLDDQPRPEDLDGADGMSSIEAPDASPSPAPLSPQGAQERIAALESALADREAQLAALSERPSAPAPSEAVVMVEQQRQQIERLTAQIAALKLTTDVDEVRRRSQRIAELSEALRRVGADSDEAQETIDLNQRLAELNVEVGRMRLEAEQAKVAAEQAHEQLQLQVAGTAAGWTDQALAASREAKIAALQARVDGLEVDLSQRPAPAPAQPQEAPPPAADPAKEAALQKRIEQLEHALNEARSAPRGPAGPRTTRAAAPASHKDVELRTKHVSQMNEQRQRLNLMHAQLKAAEKKMKRRWARPHAVVVLGWMVAGTATFAAASWMLASRYFPAVICASVDLVAKTPPGKTLSAEQSAGWQTWHAGMITDSRFQMTLAKRMGERRLDRYDNPKAFSQWLSEDLTVDTSHRGRITLTLAGTSKHEVTQFLDILAITLASVSARQVGNRSDGAPAQVQGQRKERGHLRFATVNPVAIVDHRLSIAGGIFGVLMSACIVLFRRIHRSALKKRRIVTDDLLDTSLFS